MAIRATLDIVGLMIYDDSLFDNLDIPTGMDISIAVGDIILNCAGLELCYPDWDFMHEMIGLWSSKNLENWTKLYATTQLQYDPIANVDAEEETRRNGNNGGSVTTEAQTAAYNTSTYQPEAKTVSTPATNWNDYEKKTRHGNIGVTSTQDLIRQEREIDTFNVYDVITKSFKENFCLGVYC